ncbi:HipA family kinase [Arthrobacter sp. UNC362MFTsu5.1]|uniref:HipA family kinase n=1 Tax=Arthrobacter sp. UNC362MFTsu5.1 TaxID=1449044 RepID=UPI003FA40E78
MSSLPDARSRKFFRGRSDERYGSVVRRVKPGLRVTEISARPEFGTKDIWIGSSKSYVKIQDSDAPRLVAHEFLAARLANGMGIPVPFGEVAQLDDERFAWAVAHIGSDGEAFAPPDMSVLLQRSPHVLAGISVFDTWIHNTDRTDENLIWHDSVGLWAIDHEQAFCGSSADPAKVLRGSHESITPLHAMEGLSVSSLEVLPWLLSVRTHGKPLATRACEEAWSRGLITRPEAEAYQRFLSVRAATIGALVTTSLRLTENPLESIRRGEDAQPPNQPIDLFTSSEEE